jgi:hypothetical protein
VQRSETDGPADLDPRLGGILVRPLGGFRWREEPTFRQTTALRRSSDVAPCLIAQEGEGWRTFEPLRSRRLPQEARTLAAKLSSGSEETAKADILGFANRHGFLGTASGVFDSSDNLIGYGEPFSAWEEPLIRFREIAVLWDATVAAHQAPNQRDRNRLDETLLRVDGGGRELRLGQDRAWIPASDLRGRPLWQVVAERLRSMVTKSLDGHIRVEFEPGSPLRFRPDSVLTAIYLDLAMEMAGQMGARLRECDFCHRPYRAGRSDSRFCSDTCRSQARHVRTRGRTNEA